MKIDMQKLTLGDLEDFSDYCGLSLGELQEQAANPPVKAITALVWVAGRQDNPTFTIDDARRVPLSEVELDYGQNGAADLANPPEQSDGAG